MTVVITTLQRLIIKHEADKFRPSNLTANKAALQIALYYKAYSVNSSTMNFIFLAFEAIRLCSVHLTRRIFTLNSFAGRFLVSSLVRPNTSAFQIRWHQRDQGGFDEKSLCWNAEK